MRDNKGIGSSEPMKKRNMTPIWTRAAGAVKEAFSRVTRGGSDVIGALGGCVGRLAAKIGSRKALWRPVLYGLAALCAQAACLPGDIRPFAAAFIAVPTNNAAVTAAMVGALVGCLLYAESALPLFILYFLFYTVRKAFTVSRFEEPLRVRMAECAGFSVLSGVIRMLVEGREILYALLSTVVMAGISAVFAWLLAVLTDKTAAKEATESVKNAAEYAMAGVAVLALHGAAVFGVRADVTAACVITLLFAARKGFAQGGIIGFVTGLACASPVISASLGLSGMVGALLYPKSVFAACAAFVCCMPGCHICAGNVYDALYTLPEVLIAAMIFAAVNARVCRMAGRRRYVEDADERMASGAACTVRQGLTDAFFAVSDMFAKLADKKRYPSCADVGVIVDKAFCDVCTGCALTEMCFAKRQTDTEELKGELYAVLSARAAENADFGSVMNDKCIRLDALCAAVNTLYTALAAKTGADNRSALAASGYASMARIVEDLSQREKEVNGRDEAFEKAVERALAKADIPFDAVCVCSEREKKTAVRGVDPARVPFGTKEFARYLYAECGVRVWHMAFDVSENALPTLTFERAPVISVEYAGASRKKNGERVNGDASAMLKGGRGHFYAILCDGMGSGFDAAAASRLGTVFLEHTVDTVLCRPLLLEMLNSALLSQPGEHFTTVDLLEIDLFTGRCTFIKAGAAPSYILRGSKLYKIASETPPAGILPSFTAESTRFDVRPGDWIFLVSDGVLAEPDELPPDTDADTSEYAWLAGLMKTALPTDPSLIAAKLLESVDEAARNDDSTVSVIRVTEAAG